MSTMTAILFAAFLAMFQQPALGEGEVVVRLETALGVIDIAVDTKRAPVRFHRTTHAGNYTPAPPNRPLLEVIQAGINPDMRGRGFPAIPLERTTVTGIRHVVGVVSMARGGPDSATSDFFICLNDQPSLDMGGLRFDDGQGAAAFGRVVSGLDVARAIQKQPFEAQRLTPPVAIVKASRLSPL